MPKYFFSVRRLGRLIENEPYGLILPNVMAALSHAEQVIEELKNKDDLHHAELMMIVQNETHATLLYLPFLPGCA
jgi:hypothetical protein